MWPTHGPYDHKNLSQHRHNHRSQHRSSLSLIISLSLTSHIPAPSSLLSSKSTLLPSYPSPQPHYTMMKHIRSSRQPHPAHRQKRRRSPSPHTPDDSDDDDDNDTPSQTSDLTISVESEDSPSNASHQSHPPLSILLNGRARLSTSLPRYSPPLCPSSARVTFSPMNL